MFVEGGGIPMDGQKGGHRSPPGEFGLSNSISRGPKTGTKLAAFKFNFEGSAHPANLPFPDPFKTPC